MAENKKASLTKYKEKRNFKITNEPAGKAAKGEGYIFVVQKHKARNLHYDFRLELNGVLLSWAVPKGPSLDPRDKRLAVHVEDHPVSYAAFEGTIPEGQYGAGSVKIWDSGRWAPITDPVKGMATGKLSFVLAGKKLKGEWSLVRLKSANEKSKQDNWLLIKSNDKYAKSKLSVNKT